ncbi:hypothetical protein ACWCQQ_38595 [Streptomyces sp. NPDC002143]
MPTSARPIRADVLAAKQVPKQAWNRLSCGQDAKGPRVDDWALVATANPRHHLLVRRSIAEPTDLAYFYAYAPSDRSMALADLGAIAGIRWTAEDDFTNGMDAVGLDHTQARRYRSWRRHVVLAMADLALLSVIASLDRRDHPAPVLPTRPTAEPPTDFGRIALTRHRDPPSVAAVHLTATGHAHRPRHPPHGLPRSGPPGDDATKHAPAGITTSDDSLPSTEPRNPTARAQALDHARVQSTSR